MKKNFVFAMMSAIALTGAVCVSSCSSSEDVADVNPTYDGKSLRTDFAFNISKTAQTRMSGDNVQISGTFLGMKHMYLFPFDLDGEGKTKGPAANTTTNIDNKNYALGELATSEISATKSKKIYSLVLPVGTNNFLFYGTAARGTNSNFAAGRLSSSFYDKTGAKKSTAADINNTDGISFSLENIAGSLGDDHGKISAYLTAIAKTTGWAGTVATASGTTVENPGAYKALADLYIKFTTTANDRCGSVEAVERTILDLYKGAAAINLNSSVTEVKTIATAICTSIDTKVNELRVLVSASDADPNNWTATMEGVSDRTWPASIGLPMGAAQLEFNSSNSTFAYKGAVAAGSSIISGGLLYTNICYPAELVYFDNSPLRATDSYKTESDFPSKTDTWDETGKSSSTEGFTTDWNSDEVKASTRAVAMTNNVNYGVALLETTVKLEQESLTDNMENILGGSAQNQTDIAGTGMKVTGLLIGGQPASVDWNMINPDDEFGKVIYDNDITFKETALSTSASASNYTIVLDNYKGSAQADQQKQVYIALQIKNGDKDFYGKDGMIPANHIFYLVGYMNLDDGAYTPATRKGTYRITNEDTKRVFIQDYKTIANITISADALQKAYSSIPDLRSTETVFGLSVDLSWEAGITFTVNM